MLAAAVLLAGGAHSGLRDPSGRRVCPDAPFLGPVPFLGGTPSDHFGVDGDRTPTVTVIDDVAVLWLPSCPASDAARYLRTGSRALDGAGERVGGWVLDLRGNCGGSMWPMLAVVAPLLPIGCLGQFVSADGTRLDWILERRRVRAGRTVQSRCLLPAASMEDRAVAVLIGAGTASSGEAVAVSFRARPRTRSFGEPSRGYTSANTVHRLPDGSQLILTTAWLAEATGRICPERLDPDETTGADTLARGLAWARSGS